MSFTNAQLATKISDLIAFWSTFNEQYKNWLGGTVTGGPSSDGYYPLTDYTGEESLVACPALLSDNVDGFVGDASASATAAAASEAAAATSESNAATSAATATAQAVLADADRIAAELAETGAVDAKVTAIAQAAAALVSANNAATSETNAATSETNAGLAEDAAEAWANTPEDTLVANPPGDGTTEYSALHWAAKAAVFNPALYAALADNENFTHASGIQVGGAAITAALIGNWNSAYGWGDHSGLYSVLAHVHEGTAIDATAITDGYVLTADGAGNAAWEVAAGGGLSADVDEIITAAWTFEGVVTLGPSGGGATVTWDATETNSSITLSGGNLTAVRGAGTAWHSTQATPGKSSGKWYWEVTLDTSSATWHVIGLALAALTDTEFPGQTSTSYGVHNTSNGTYYNNNSSKTAGAMMAGIGAGDIVMIAMNMDSGNLWFGQNGTWDGDPVAGTGAIYAGLTGTMLPSNAMFSTGQVTAAFDSVGQTYSPPSGFLPISGGAVQCTLTWSDPTLTIDGGVAVTGALAVTGAVTGSNLNVANWDTAYGWGDHDTQGYLTATEVNTQVGLNTTAPGVGDSYWYHWRSNAASPTIYIRQAGAGPLARFFKNAAAAATSGTGTVEFGNDGLIEADGGFAPALAGVTTGKVVYSSSVGSVKLTGQTYYAELGCRNSSYFHMSTNASAGFYMYDHLTFAAGQSLKRTGEGAHLGHSSSAYADGGVTFSTSAPSGGANGDIWFEYT